MKFKSIEEFLEETRSNYNSLPIDLKFLIVMGGEYDYSSLSSSTTFTPPESGGGFGKMPYYGEDDIHIPLIKQSISIGGKAIYHREILAKDKSSQIEEEDYQRASWSKVED